MLKLVSVNMEGEKHFPRVLSLITTEAPDVVCLQECPQSFQFNLQNLGYTTDFLPMHLMIQNDVAYLEGLVFASKTIATTFHKYYYQPDRTLPPQPIPTPKPAMHHGYIFATLEHNNETFNIANTHVMVTSDGLPTEHQTQGVKKLLSLLQNEKSHVLCGDFNIPRGINPLYDEFTKLYSDKIPHEYTSSLDKTLHRAGKSLTLNAPIFDTYMVDYLFTKPEYITTDVRLQLGVSDHAAVIATVAKSL